MTKASGVSESRESRSLGSLGVLGVSGGSESPTVNCTIAFIENFTLPKNQLKVNSTEYSFRALMKDYTSRTWLLKNMLDSPMPAILNLGSHIYRFEKRGWRKKTIVDHFWQNPTRQKLFFLKNFLVFCFFHVCWFITLPKCHLLPEVHMEELPWGEQFICSLVILFILRVRRLWKCWTRMSQISKP